MVRCELFKRRHRCYSDYHLNTQTLRWIYPTGEERKTRSGRSRLNGPRPGLSSANNKAIAAQKRAPRRGGKTGESEIRAHLAEVLRGVEPVAHRALGFNGKMPWPSLLGCTHQGNDHLRLVGVEIHAEDPGFSDREWNGPLNRIKQVDGVGVHISGQRDSQDHAFRALIA